MTTSMLISKAGWREKVGIRHVSIALVLTIAAVLRVRGLSQGVPYALGIDEPEVMERAVRIMKTGDFNPHFFDYPSGVIYLHAIVAILRFLSGAMRGEWASLAEAPTDAFYMWGRAVTAILGAAAVGVIYRVGLHWGTRHALLAAGLLAVMPMHVRESHFVLTDVPLTLLVTVTFLASLRASETPTIAAFASAGAAAGLASALKYTGLPALLLPLITCFMVSALPRPRIQVVLVILGSFVGAYLLAAPYTVLDLPSFLNGFAHLAAVYGGRPPAEPPAITYLKHLRINFGSAALLLSVAGLILALVRLARGPGRVRWALLAAFPIAYFALISRQFLVYGRYLLPAIPFLCLSAACAVIAGAGRLQRAHIPRPIRTAVTAAVILVALARPTYLAVQFDRNMAKTWTTKLAYDWVRQHVPPGSRVIMETRVVLLPAEYRIENVRQLRLRSYDEYVAGGAEYLIASSAVYGRFLDASQQFPEEYADYTRLFGRAAELARFVPSAENPGPELRILRVQPSR